MAGITATSNTSLLMCSCYRPPNSDHSWLDKFNNFMGDVCLGHSNIVLAGDFNMPHASWDSPHGPNKSPPHCPSQQIPRVYSIKIKTISVRRTLYLSLVRSHLAYASQVWAPQTVDLIKRTERVQRRASKYILGLRRRSSVTSSISFASHH